MHNFIGNSSSQSHTAGGKAYMGETAVAVERTHVEELQRAVNAVRSLVDNIHRFRDSVSGNDRPPESDCAKIAHTPCLLDQLIQTPSEIHQACEEGFKTLETLRGYLRLR